MSKTLSKTLKQLFKDYKYHLIFLPFNQFKKVLHLKLPTDPRWVDLTAISVEDILTDHAYCEQKAASSGISLIQNFSQYEYLVNAVTPLVSEEWGHFRLVLKELRKRNLKS